MKRILIAFIVASILEITPHLFADTAQAWDVMEICSTSKNAVWLLVLLTYIPYKQLFAKSFVLVLFINELMDPLTYITWPLLKNLYLTYSIKFTVGLALILHIWWKNYETANDELDEHHFFRVGIRPKGLQDFLLSLIKDPIGGVGIYARGQYYHYRHGKLAVHDRKYLERTKHLYRIKRMRRIDEKRLAILKALKHSKYSQWSWLWGCKTVLEPILGKRGKPLFMRKD